MNRNLVIFLGRLGSDPELYSYQDGRISTRLSVAINREEKTDWFSVFSWRDVAEDAFQYLKKGDLVYIEAKLGSARDNPYRKIITADKICPI